MRRRACADGDDRAADGRARRTHRRPVAPSEAHALSGAHGTFAGRTYFDLVASSHLADLDRGGAFVAFGTPSRHKHTSGTWNSGWGADVVRGDERFTRFGSMGRVYFDVRSPGSHLLRLSIRNVGGGPLLVFLNDAPLGEHVVEPGAFREVVVPVPAEHVRLGENYLLLRGTETRDVDGEAASFEVATLHARHAGGGDAPFLRRGPQVAQGIAREGLAFSPGTTVSWHVEIPRAAHGATQLRFAHASADRLVVRATTDRGDTTELLDAPASEAFVDHAIDLSPPRGQARPPRLSLPLGRGLARRGAADAAGGRARRARFDRGALRQTRDRAARRHASRGRLAGLRPSLAGRDADHGSHRA
ncbi:MAG: hypothetical protein H6720_27975 [Sandaracinus sp.]|nr:hypothetical protein [Sandaracinus sp.]